MIRLKLTKNTINKNSIISILIDPYIALWLKIGTDKESINSYYIYGRNGGILTIGRESHSKQISEIILVSSKEIEYSNKIEEKILENILNFEAIPSVRVKNRNHQKELLYNNFKIYYSQNSIEIKFLNIVRNYDNILKKIIKIGDIYFKTNKNGTLISILLTKLPRKVIENMLEILNRKKLKEYLKFEINEEENDYIVIDNPFPAPKIW